MERQYRNVFFGHKTRAEFESSVKLFLVDMPKDVWFDLKKVFGERRPKYIQAVKEIAIQLINAGWLPYTTISNDRIKRSSVPNLRGKRSKHGS